MLRLFGDPYGNRTSIILQISFNAIRTNDNFITGMDFIKGYFYICVVQSVVLFIDNDYIHIRRAINAKGITTNGKNEFAARDFPQTRYTRMLLESQQVYRVTPLDPHERVFGSTGQLCYRKRWGIYCRYNGIPYITPYELRHTFSSIYKNHFSNWVYEELVGHTHPGVNGVYMHPMDGDMDGVPALLDSLLDERLSLGRAKRMLLSNGQTK